MFIDIPTLYNLKNLRVQMTIDNLNVRKSVLNAAAGKMAHQLDGMAHSYGVDIPADEVTVQKVGEDEPRNTADYGAWWSPPESPIELSGGQEDGAVLEIQPGMDRVRVMARSSLTIFEKPADEDVSPPLSEHFEYEYVAFNTETRRRVFRLRP